MYEETGRSPIFCERLRGLGSTQISRGILFSHTRPYKKHNNIILSLLWGCKTTYFSLPFLSFSGKPGRVPSETLPTSHSSADRDIFYMLFVQSLALHPVSSRSFPPTISTGAATEKAWLWGSNKMCNRRDPEHAFSSRSNWVGRNKRRKVVLQLAWPYAVFSPCACYHCSSSLPIVSFLLVDSFCSTQPEKEESSADEAKQQRIAAAGNSSCGV